MQFHEYLKQLIKARNLTQAAVADALSMDKSYLSRLLNYRHDSLPNETTIEKICDTLECLHTERLKLYRLAGKVPPEIVAAYCESDERAQVFFKVAVVPESRLHLY